MLSDALKQWKRHNDGIYFFYVATDLAFIIIVVFEFSHFVLIYGLRFAEIVGYYQRELSAADENLQRVALAAAQSTDTQTPDDVIVCVGFLRCSVLCVEFFFRS